MSNMLFGSAKKRRIRTRNKISNVSDRPRLTVFRSNRYFYGQIVDDVKGVTLVSTEKNLQGLHQGKPKSEAAFEVGKDLAEKALKKGVKEVVFDRGSYKYHGRVRKFAEGAREGGLNF